MRAKRNKTSRSVGCLAIAGRDCERNPATSRASARECLHMHVQACVFSLSACAGGVRVSWRVPLRVRVRVQIEEDNPGMAADKVQKEAEAAMWTTLSGKTKEVRCAALRCALLRCAAE